MRVVVTGACGFIGSHVCERLAVDNEVVGIDCLLPNLYSADVKSERIPALTAAGVRVEHADLRIADLDPVLDGSTPSSTRPRWPGLAPSWATFEPYVTLQRAGYGRLHRPPVRARRRKLRADLDLVGLRLNAVGDEPSPRAVSPYGVSKLAAEQLSLRSHHNHDLPVMIVRYFSIYGPRQRPDMAYNRLHRGDA